MDQKPIEGVLGNLTGIFKKEYAKRAKVVEKQLYMPKSNKEKWWCTCGAENDIKTMKCTHCGIGIKELVNILNKKYLSEIKEKEEVPEYVRDEEKTHDLVDVESTANIAVVEQPKGACPYCGKKVKKNTSFCPHCGKKLNSSPAEPEKKTKPRKRRRGITGWVKIAAGVICVAVIAGAVFFFWPKSDSSKIVSLLRDGDTKEAQALFDEKIKGDTDKKGDLESSLGELLNELIDKYAKGDEDSYQKAYRTCCVKTEN